MSERRFDIACIAMFLCLIFIPAALFWVTPDKATSEDENRSLQQFPKFSPDGFVSGKFTSDFVKYYSDQFIFRDVFVGAKTMFSYAFLINENKGAIIAKDGYIIQRFDKYSEKSIAEKSSSELGGDLTFDENMANIKNNCGYVEKFAQNIGPGINITFAVPPRKIDVMTNKLPAFFPVDRNEAYFDQLRQYTDSRIYFDLLGALKPHNEEYIYYKTDHHWTTLGAFLAYGALGEKMGYEPLPIEDFDIETASDDFYGVTWSKTGAKWISPDRIEYYRTKGEDDIFVTEIHGANPKTLKGFYDLEKLETKDKYSSFLGGINSHISIYMPPSGFRRKLLLVADSFGGALVPFLARHFDIELIDTRFFDDKIYDFIDEHGITDILILHNMENLSTQNNLVKLTRN